MLDVACIGHASYDLVFSVPHHPSEDEKCVAAGFVSCGGGPAANAAVAVARMGKRAAFVGYLGRDLYGQAHFDELLLDGVDTSWLIRGSLPTPLSAVLVKPDGRRALINYRGDTRPLAEEALSLDRLKAKVVLFDGHEPALSVRWVDDFRRRDMLTVLDAGSLHEGTRALMSRVDFLVASRKFAAQWLGRDDPLPALAALARQAPVVVITLGEEGLIWREGSEQGEMPAISVQAVDTTGAGDTFHGVFAACIAEGMGWLEALRFSNVAAGLCCTRMGARPGIPARNAVESWLRCHQ